MDVLGRHLPIILCLLLTFKKQVNGKYKVIKLSNIIFFFIFIMLMSN